MAAVFERVGWFEKIFELSLKFLVLSLTDVERVGGGVRGERETEGERDMGEKEGEEWGRERDWVRGRKGGR